MMVNRFQQNEPFYLFVRHLNSSDKIMNNYWHGECIVHIWANYLYDSIPLISNTKDGAGLADDVHSNARCW